MAGGTWRVAAGLLVLAGVAGCSGANQAANASRSTAKAASVEGITAAMLKNALLTKVNGVPAAGPASSGSYASLTKASTKAGAQKQEAVQVTPQVCGTAAAQGFNPATFAGSPAATVSFKVGSNGVSEVLIASTAKSATAALAGRIPAACAHYQEKINGKTYSYGITEQAVTGVGTQAKALNVHATGAAAADNLWSLIYRGAGFVGTVTVIGPNASEKAVQQLGQQAYAFATKSLS